MTRWIEGSILRGLHMPSLEARGTLRHVILHHAKEGSQAKPTVAEVGIVGHG
jgi:hypothetical protein